MGRSGIWLVAAGVFGAVAVAAGAWAAHGLADNPPAQQLAETASRYQILHAAVLLALQFAPVADGWAARGLSAARWLFVIGVLLFSGTLYALALGGGAPFSGSAPLGGTLLICGWLCVAAAGLRRGVVGR